MIVNENFKKVLLEHNLNNNEFSKLKGVKISRGTVDNIVNDGNPGIKVIYDILAVFPSLNIDWLFTGRGDQYFLEKETLNLQVEEPEGTYETQLRLLKQKNNQLVNENNDLKNKLIEIQSIIIKSAEK